MVSLRDFPYTSALFGLVSYNDPSKKRLQTSEIDPLFFWGGGEALFVHEVCVLSLFGSFGRSEVKEFVRMMGAPPFKNVELCWLLVMMMDDGCQSQAVKLII